MRLGLTLALLVACASLMSGCNTSDALTPKVDVGNGQVSESTPITQNDLDTVANTPQPMIDNGNQSVTTGNPTAMQTQSNNGQILGQLTVNSDGTVKNANGGQTLQQQQQALQAQQTQQALQAQQTQQTQQTQQLQTSNQVAAVSPAGASIRFLPIIGAPVEAVTPLSKQLGAQARASGLTIKASADNTSDHILKGYFSAASDGTNTNVTYVWDVLDASGARMHRIQGTELVPGTAKEAWTVVPAAVMQTIANKTIGEYLRWRGSGKS